MRRAHTWLSCRFLLGMLAQSKSRYTPSGGRASGTASVATVLGWSRSKLGRSSSGDPGLVALDEAIAALETVRGSLQVKEREHPAMLDVAAEYGADATAAMKRSNVLLVACVLILAPLFLGSWLLASSDEDLTVARGLSVAAAFVALLGLLVAIGRQSLQSRKAATEARRLQRQLQTLACIAQDATPYDRLIRLALLHRVFPRSIDDRDPLSEPDWVTGDDVRTMWERLGRQDHQ